ncbi:MAG: acetate--CoA ligase family protein [Alphaproteobacteria bacterium]|nr:acetate--CoA ligase family protein [Alphaproteobacteria bacterium]
MKVFARNTYGGPNYLAPRALAMIAVDFGDFAGRVVAGLPRPMVDRLRAMAPEAAGTLDAVRGDGETTVPQLLARMARDLQRAGHDEVDYAGVIAGPGAVRYVLVGFVVAEVGHASLDLARALLADALGVGAVDTASARRTFARLVERFQLVHTTRFLLRAANRRGIPWHRLAPFSPVIQLGHGRHQQRLTSTITSRLALAPRRIAGDKAMAHDLMRRAGVPVPDQIRVGSAAAAVQAARSLGYPVVVKAAQVDKGQGVTLDVRDDAAVTDAYGRLAHHGSIVVERLIPGDDHRLFVVDCRVVAVARRLSARVVGDGAATIRELVDRLNADPRRGANETSPLLVRVALDEETARVLADQGLDLDDVPISGRVVLLRHTANVSMGATAEDVTPITHPDYVAAAETAARVVGLDFAGVDLLTTDITRPLAETKGGICEINANPGVRPHVVDPASPDVVGAMLASLFPRDDGRVPVAAITGSNGKTTTARMVARIMRAAGLVTGLASTSSVEIDDRILTVEDSAGPTGARMVFEDPTVEVAVLETARGGIWHNGLAFDRCTVGAVLNVGDDHVGTEGIRDRPMLARIKRLVVEAATELAVLNATDPACIAMRPHSPARAACWIALDPACPLVGERRPAGDLAVTVAGTGPGAVIVVRIGLATIPVVRVADLPSVDAGRARHNLENALFATGIAWGLGAHVQAIADGLMGYALSFASSRGRTTRYHGLPFAVLIDFAHNPEAMEAISRYAAALDVAGRRLCVLHGPGNRPEAHYRALARAAASAFDRFFVCDPEERRGRAPGEAARLVADGLVAAGIDPTSISVLPDEVDAVKAALAAARPGDLLAAMAFYPARAFEIVRAFDVAASDGRAPAAPGGAAGTTWAGIRPSPTPGRSR